MKYPTKLSDAAHILAFIALHPECDLTSGKLAESVQTNPAYVRQLMSAMRKGGLLLSVKGLSLIHISSFPSDGRTISICPLSLT